MQKELLSILNKIKKWIEKNKVVDVVLFGSALREKYSPNDIDICILIEKEDEKKSLDLIESLGNSAKTKNLKVQINILTTTAFLSGNSLAKTLLNEGYSIKKSKSLASVLGFENKSIFVYSLKNFTPSKRVKFHYLLQGRNGAKGILKEVQGTHFGAGTILLSTQKEDLLKEVFEMWNVKYEIHRILLS